MGLFNKNQTVNVRFSQRQLLENTAKNTRHNILLVLVFTVINVLLLVSGANSYFLFSAYVPYALADYGMFFGGMYPTEYYGEYLSEVSFLGTGFFAVMISLAVAVLVLYLVCWILAKKKPKTWLTVALVLFGIDTVVLLWWLGFSADLLLDYVFHVWVIVSLVKGLSALKKLKELPEEVEAPMDVVDAAPAEETPAEECPEEELLAVAPAEEPEAVTVEE